MREQEANKTQSFSQNRSRMLIVTVVSFALAAISMLGGGGGGGESFRKFHLFLTYFLENVTIMVLGICRAPFTRLTSHCR